MTTIVCLKWGDKYGAEYVNRLFAAVKRNSTVQFKFMCFTDSPNNICSGIDTQPLPFKALEGWWNKLYLFSREAPIQGRIFYVDLDTLITGNIDDLLVRSDPFIVLRDFYTGIATSVKGNDNMGSGLMSWTAGEQCHIWDSFIANPTEAIASVYPFGDQHWVQKMQPNRVYWQDILPNKVVSFKVHCRDGLPPDARVVCYHGKPSIPDSITKHTKDWKWNLQPAPWVANYWKDE